MTAAQLDLDDRQRRRQSESHRRRADRAEDLLRDLRVRAKRADQARQDAETGAQREAARLGLRLTAIEAARTKLLAEHKDELDSEAMATLVAELDLEEEQVRVAMGER